MAEPQHGSPEGGAKISQAVIIKCNRVVGEGASATSGSVDVPSAAASPSGPSSLQLHQPVSRSPVHAAGFFHRQQNKSLLPKPEISPKPAHLKQGCLMTGSLNFNQPPTDLDQMASSSSGGSLKISPAGRAASTEILSSSSCGSQKSPTKQLPNEVAVTTATNGQAAAQPAQQPEAPTTKTLVEKTKGTASILKSTLKRMTKLSIRAASTSSSSSSSSSSAATEEAATVAAAGGHEPHQSPLRRSMSPFRSSKRYNSQQHVVSSSSPEHQSLTSLNHKSKSNSLRRSHANGIGHDVASGMTSSLKKGSSVSQNSLNRNKQQQQRNHGGSCTIAYNNYNGSQPTSYHASLISKHSAAAASSNNGGAAETFKVPSADATAAAIGRSLSRSSSASSTNNMANGHMHHNHYMSTQAIRSHSLKRVTRNKDSAAASQASGSSVAASNSLQRTASGSGLNNQQITVKRSNSMHQSAHYAHARPRTFRDRDLNVKLSRGIQTQLTKDVMDDMVTSSTANDDAVNTEVQFQLYMPDLLGGETGNEVETHVSEPTEPVDVRRNRQLTLDNMKLHREIEKLKSAANESDHLKRELRSVRSRLEEEQRARQRIEQELDQHNEKVKLIARSMDSVEQEFEIRDANIRQLENQLSHSRSHIATLDDKLKVANDVISSQNVDLAEAVRAQKAAIREYEAAESEANELHEFLQAEKFTLAEALKEAEAEVEALKAKVATSEVQCGHLVRLGEQRHQEILSLETQLKAMEDKAKEMLLAQGAEISRSTILIAELSCKIEDAFQTHFPKAFQAISSMASSASSNGGARPHQLISADDIAGELDASQLTDQLVMQAAATPTEEESSSSSNHNGCDDSLLSLSKAIKNRVSVENSCLRSPKTSVSGGGGVAAAAVAASASATLVDRVSQVDKLVELFVAAQKEAAAVRRESDVGSIEPVNQTGLNGTALNGRISPTENGIENHPTDQKENISLNGNSDGGSVSSSSTSSQQQLPTATGSGGESSPSKMVVKKYEEEMAEMKAKYLKHRQILMANREAAESEVMRLDDIYHDTVNDVLDALASLPIDVVQNNPELSVLQAKLQAALLDEDTLKTGSSSSVLAGNSKLKNCNGILPQNAAASTHPTEQGL